MVLGDGQPKPAKTRQEAEQEVMRAENWRMVSAPVAFGGGWLAAAAAGAPVAAPVAGVIFGGLAVASWLERRRTRQARARAATRGRA
jgi:hypothetical protein